MKSRTSFFNLTLYRKDITRFAPLWVLYTVGIILLMLPLVNLNGYFRDTARTLNSTIGPLSIMNLFYGVLAAQLLFGELFNSRLCNALHAMPITRRARFGSHILAGLSFSIVPNLAGCLLMMPYLSDLWFTGLLWLLAMTLQYLFFFGAAVIAMFCTGNRFAAALVYAIINFGSMMALWFASVIFLPMMRGVVLSWEEFANFSPVVKLCMTGEYFLLDKVGYSNPQTTFTGMGGDWICLVIYAAVGVLAIAGSFLLYRRRALESAGDFMAVKALGPVFLVLYTLCAGAFLAVFGSIFRGDTYLTFLIIGLIVGFFTGKMLLERTSRVFHLKSFIHLGIFVLLMWLSLQAVQFDVFGIVGYVPEPNTVAKAEVLTYDYGKNEVETSDLAELETLKKAHRLAIEEEGCKHDVWQTYYITYHMKDGRTVKREYTLCTSEAASTELEKLFSSPHAILGIQNSWENYLESVTGIQVNGMARRKFINAEDWEQLLECIYEDCEQGLMGSKGGAISNYAVTVYRGEKAVDLRLRVNSCSYSWMQTYEKKDRKSYLEAVTAITLDGVAIGNEHYEAIVEALYADAMEHSYVGWGVFAEEQDAPHVLRIRTAFTGEEEELYIAEYLYNTYEWIKEYLLEQGG